MHTPNTRKRAVSDVHPTSSFPLVRPHAADSGKRFINILLSTPPPLVWLRKLEKETDAIHTLLHCSRWSDHPQLSPNSRKDCVL